MKHNRLRFYLALTLVIAGTAGPAIYFGHLQGPDSSALRLAQQRLESVPSHFGAWHLQEEQPLPDSTVNMLQCSAHLSRRYVHQETGRIVELVILVGDSGPLVAHTPEVCMRSREFQQIRPATQVQGRKGDRENHFLVASFRARTVEGEKLDVYYAWSRDGEVWEAPDSPRVSLGPLPLLYKVQAASADSVSVEGEEPAALALLNDLLPILASESQSVSLAENG